MSIYLNGLGTAGANLQSGEVSAGPALELKAKRDRDFSRRCLLHQYTCIQQTPISLASGMIDSVRGRNQNFQLRNKRICEIQPHGERSYRPRPAGDLDQFAGISRSFLCWLAAGFVSCFAGGYC